MNKKVLSDNSSLNLIKTFECGQCFRWNAYEDGAYFGVVDGVAAKVWSENDKIYINSSSDYNWEEYFDLNLDYRAISIKLDINEYMHECIEYGIGIRILKQNSWEALCSFIISQCNNIPRIKGIVEKLCLNFGNQIEFDNKIFYSFPSAEKISKLSINDLDVLRCGYRAPYILNAAKLVSDNVLDLESLKLMSSEKSYNELLKLDGVGPKVANCENLFGLHHLDAFPIDVWMKRAISKHFNNNLDPNEFGDYAGLAQQYMFYSERSEINKK